MTTPTTPAHTSDTQPDHQRRLTTYERYLRTDELLALQKPAAERLHPDELTFQTVHQTFELWWKVPLQQFNMASALLSDEEYPQAAWALRRAVTAQTVVMHALRQLEFITPADFLIIRAGLEDGSGGDSPGFRAILRTAPDLWDSFSAALDRVGISLLELYTNPKAQPALYDCAEALTDFDEQFHLFRAAHLKLAERNLGLRAIGTGGTPMPALEKTLRDLLFLPLWEVRDALLAQAQRQQGQSAGTSSSAHPPVTGHGQ
jgi:tryptophan 2,3-dioxygenase